MHPGRDRCCPAPAGRNRGGVLGALPRRDPSRHRLQEPIGYRSADDTFGGEDVARQLVSTMPDATVTMVPDATYPRVLDLGCRTGANVVELPRRGFDATGMDFSPVTLDEARARAREAGVTDRCRFPEADLTAGRCQPPRRAVRPAPRLRHTRRPARGPPGADGGPHGPLGPARRAGPLLVLPR
jgi:SAM-dependent methyltransferase